MRYPWWNSVVAAVFLIFLVLPGGAYLAGMRADPDFEFRESRPFPRFDITRVGEPKFYDEIDTAIRDRNPVRRYFVEGYTNIVYFLTGEVESKRVSPGRDGWFFITDSLTPPCRDDGHLRRWASNVKALQTSIERSGKTFVFTIAPDKITVYPEQATSRDRARAECSRENLSRFQSFLNVAGVSAINMAADLDKAKRTGPRMLYSARDTHWNEWGASIFTSSVLRFLAPVMQIVPFSERGFETHIPDLNRLSGLFWEEVSPIVRSRPDGVVNIKRAAKGEGERPVMQSVSVAAQGIPMSPARLGIVHDSFLYVAWNQIAEYAETIEYMHWSTLDEEGLVSIVGQSDVVVFETVQREAWTRLETWFSDDRLARALP